MCREGKYKSHDIYIVTTETVAGNALKSGAKTTVMATVRRERSSRSGKGRHGGWDAGRGRGEA